MPVQRDDPEFAHAIEHITPRRAYLLRLLAAGMNLRELAAVANITYETARAEMRHLRYLTGCLDLAELAWWWREYRRDWLLYLVAIAGVRPEDVPAPRRETG